MQFKVCQATAQLHDCVFGTCGFQADTVLYDAVDFYIPNTVLHLHPLSGFGSVSGLLLFGQFSAFGFLSGLWITTPFCAWP